MIFEWNILYDTIQLKFSMDQKSMKGLLFIQVTFANGQKGA